MKGLYVIGLFLLMAIGCSKDDEEDISFEILPIESVEVPDFFVYQNQYIIPITFQLPTSCHEFYDFSYESISEGEREVGVVSIIQNSPACDLNEKERITQDLYFVARHNGTYTFKFWKGEDSETREDLWIVVEVPVYEYVD